MVTWLSDLNTSSHGCHYFQRLHSECSARSLVDQWEKRESLPYQWGISEVWLKSGTLLLPTFQCLDLDLVMWSLPIQGSKKCSLLVWPGRRWSQHALLLMQTILKLFLLICLKITILYLLTSTPVKSTFSYSL